MGSVLKHVKINSLGLKWKGAVGVLSPLASKSCEGSQRAKHARKHRLTTFGQFHSTTCFRSMLQRYSKSRWSHWKFTVEILPSPGKNGRLELKFIYRLRELWQNWMHFLISSANKGLQYIYLLGAYSETEVTGDLMKAILNCSGEEDLAWCQTFKRALVNGEVYHSKSYGRVFRRNSYSDLWGLLHEKRVLTDTELH